MPITSIRRQRELAEQDNSLPAPAPAPAPVVTTAPAPAPTPAPATTVSTPPAPSWWRMAALTPSTDSSSFLNLANALLPYYAPADQVNVATFLASDPAGTAFRDYLDTAPRQTAPTGETRTRTLHLNPEPGMNPAAMTYREVGGNAEYPHTPSPNSLRQAYLSSGRAGAALNQLAQMQAAAGLTDDAMGPGFRFVRSALQLLANLGINAEGGEQSMTRAEYEEMQSAFGAMRSQAETDRTLAPYAELASKFLNPTGMNLMASQTFNNNTLYGQRNRRFYR